MDDTDPNLLFPVFPNFNSTKISIQMALFAISCYHFSIPTYQPSRTVGYKIYKELHFSSLIENLTCNTLKIGIMTIFFVQFLFELYGRS